MIDIADFVKARLDERAAKAKAACGDGEGRWTQPDADREPGRIEDERGEVVSYYEGKPTEAQADHITENDPAYVLRDVAAKRRIIELHHPDRQLENWYWPERECAECGHRWHRYILGRLPTEVGPEVGCRTLRLLAEIDDDHPDYDERWRS